MCNLLINKLSGTDRNLYEYKMKFYNKGILYVQINVLDDFVHEYLDIR